jgi:hypothetical protein
MIRLLNKILCWYIDRINAEVRAYNWRMTVSRQEIREALARLERARDAS